MSDGWGNSAALKTALSLPGIFLQYLIPSVVYEGEYQGPEALKKFLCGCWSENNTMIQAMYSCSRMETILYPLLCDDGEKGLRVEVRFLPAGKSTAFVELEMYIDNMGALGSIGYR